MAREGAPYNLGPGLCPGNGGAFRYVAAKAVATTRIVAAALAAALRVRRRFPGQSPGAPGKARATIGWRAFARPDNEVGD
jgi:hypothetical protein